MKKVLLIVLLSVSFLGFSQQKEVLDLESKKLSIIFKFLKENNDRLESLVNQQKVRIDALSVEIESLKILVSGLSNGTIENETDTDNENETENNTSNTDIPDLVEGLAFRGAKGAGAYASGGSGGEILRVTTLCWDCDGGLKKAIKKKGKRIIVFDVSGEIDATSQGRYVPIIKGSDFDNLTIAGQTAPKGGITIRTNEFMFQDVSNVIIRYVRFRNSESSIQDALWLTGGKDIIIDHCTFSYGGDEAMSIASGYGRTYDPKVIMGNVTIQNSFFQNSKTGSILGTKGKEGDFTIVNNVYANISHRVPANAKGDGRYDMINNVIYNWKNRLIRLGDGGGSAKINVISNYYKPSKKGLRQSGWFGSGTIDRRFLHKVQTKSTSKPLIYNSGEYFDGQTSDVKDNWAIFAGSHVAENKPIPDSFFKSTMFTLVGANYEIKTAQEAYEYVLSDVGANKTLNPDGSVHYFMDSKDTKEIENIKTDGYNGNFYGGDKKEYPTIPKNVRPSNFDSNGDGVPDAYAQKHGFNKNKDLSNHLFPNGYRGCEAWLNEI